VHRHPQYARDRARQVVDRLRALVWQDRVPPARMLLAGPVERIPYDEALVLEYEPVELGRQLGPAWATYWLDLSFTVPEAWAGSRVDLLLVSHSEATLWLDGQPVQGLHSGAAGTYRTDAPLRRRASAGETVDARVEIACNTPFGHTGPWFDTPFTHVSPYVLDRCEAGCFDADAWHLYQDARVLCDLLHEHERGLDPSWAGELMAGLDRFANAWDEHDRSTWPTAGELLRELLARRNGDTGHLVSAIGHAHIDTAWLWPLGETYRKCVRSWSSATRLMDEYPGYRFTCSQAQQYAWVEERDPALLARIRERAARGQWLPTGGTWVEPDCNLPSGESLVRQFLLGQRYFERVFGRRSTIFWNPDVFGYNGQLPQIMRGAGIERFLTQKLSWNRYTSPLYHTFRWEGIDGSQVLAHFPPADTYNADVNVETLRRSATASKDHDRTRHSLLVYGWGDGGGGPTPEMLETLVRVEDLAGVPRTEPRDPEAFFALLEQERESWPVIAGELYFEYHRGTYTSQARTKRLHRRCERLLHDVEVLASAGDPADYPREALQGLWQTVLLHEFHDILPGSSIAEVYEEAEPELERAVASLEALREACLTRVGGGVFNTVGVARREVVELEAGELAVVEAPPFGPGARVAAADAVEVEELGDAIALANGALRAVLGRDGALRSLVHRATGREALAGEGNVLELYDDHPVAFDAWDVDPFHLQTGVRCAPAASCEVVRRDPLRAEVAFERTIGERSRVRQVVRLDAHGRRLEVRCVVDWHEEHRLLKVLFPVAARSPRAVYEMQFGVVERPTHASTLADAAQFEVPGHRFADLSEHGFGVALLSAATYGWSTAGSDVRLSLLRAPRWPDPACDVGRHELAYAIYPHAGGWQDAQVTAEALAFNAPLVRADASLPRRSALVACSDPNLLVDTIKRAEDSDDLVLRLYEAHGARGVARLRVGQPFTRAVRCTLLEDDREVLELDGDAVVVPYRPFEIVSLKLS
jgi:alpha-mannosidase